MPATRASIVAMRPTIRLTAVTLATLAAPHALAAQSAGTSALADREAVVAEVRAFYADVQAGSWADVLNHFLPAKVTARWAPPVTADAWALPQPTVAATDTARLGSGGAASCTDRVNGREQVMRVGVVGTWARVVVADCAGGHDARSTRPGSRPSLARDEFWLLRVSGRWKIVHLEREPADAPR